LFPEDSPFLTTDTRKDRWAVPYTAECLNARIGVLLKNHPDALQGKRVLDAGSHIGTFAFAALRLGARAVVGVDSEPKTVDRCLALFREAEVDRECYRFEVGNVFDVLEREGPEAFDTILCFGMLYYTQDPFRLLELFSRAARETVLLDTFTAAYAAVQGKDAEMVRAAMRDETFRLPLLLTSLTRPDKKDYRLPESFTVEGRELSLMSLPTEALLETWFRALNWNRRKLDWSDHITRPCTFHDLLSAEQKRSSHWADVYASGIRVAYRLDRRDGSGHGAGSALPSPAR